MIGSRLWLTKNFSRSPRQSSHLPASKTGLPSQRADHKSDIGSLQCPGQASCAVRPVFKRRLKAVRVAKNTGTGGPEDFFKALLVTRKPLCEEKRSD